jgi:EAL domain-containing protein (putative c-di-GMP-specific phosphodiesterase class I)/DNA-binding response OmpR family regulator
MHYKQKILIVDDQEVNRTTIKLSLKNENYHFFEATNGLEALEKASEIKPDIILMDAIMPLMDGFKATKLIREIEEIQRVPILMITSLDQKEDKIRALESGVNDFISKPFDKIELKARCRSHININQLNKNYILATKNHITKLPNKVALLKQIKSNKSEQELFLIQIDNFHINENFYGSKIVEKLEIEFTNKLNKYINLSDKYTIYHVSNGKYAVYLNNHQKLDKNSLIKFCTQLSDKIKHTKYSFNDYSFDLNITISHSYGKNSLYEDANATLTTASIQEKNYLLADDVLSTIKDNLKENLSMIKDIKVALKNNKIYPYFQPIYDTKLNKVTKYEALIRMVDENGNIITPMPNFLSVAKKGKLYNEITRIVLKKALEKIRKTDYEISINISSLDIEDLNMSNYMLEILEANKDITDRLIFELLEDKETNNYEDVNTFIQQAKSYGVKIAIDDFGSGYSNFIRIIEFKPHIIKIDGSLIVDIATKKSSRQAVETIKTLADKIGAQTVAEYVSDEKIYNIVKEIGIDFIQGYYIGKPEAKLIGEKELEIA